MSHLDEKDIATHHESGCETAEDKQLGHLANAEDHGVSKWQAIKQNPWACIWTTFAIWMVLLVSYENQASGNILGIPQFRKDFGQEHDGEYVLQANWQSAFTAAPIGSYVPVSHDLLSFVLR